MMSEYIEVSLQEILLETLPKKSAAQYQKAWQMFKSEMAIPDDVTPTEAQYLRYFFEDQARKELQGINNVDNLFHA